jgi:hypothetical protein
MNEHRELRLQFLPAIILLVLIGILIAAAFNLLSGIQEPAFLTPVDQAPAAVLQDLPTATATDTITPTVTTTSRPTWTLQPTMTFTPTWTPTWTATATRERLPTLTPARPFRINERYEFMNLTAERMDQITRTVADYPDAKFVTPESRLDQAYDAYFIYPALAYQEALLRFPEAAQRTRWQWGLAYSLSRLGESQTVTLYQQFISQALNQEGLGLDELSDWFSSQTPDLTLLVHSLPLPPGQPEMSLLEIPEGNILYLLEINQAGDYQLHSLSEKFDFRHGNSTIHTVLDLDADGLYELAVYQPGSSNGSALTAPRIFDLLEPKAQSIPVEPLLPFDFQMEYTVELSSQIAAGTSLQTLTVMAVFYPSCPFSARIDYHWDESSGSAVLSGPAEYQLEPVQETLTYCEALLNHAQAFWPLEARYVVEQTLLPLWPPESDPQGRPYPASRQDELRFRHALTQALGGYPEDLQPALRTLQELVEAPVDPVGPWRTAALDFIDLLGDGSGLYRACQNSPICDLQQAFQQIARESDLQRIAAYLSQQGVTLRASGVFDFDQDGTPERWVVMRPRSESHLEFWILAETETGLQAVFVERVAVNDPKPFWSDQQVYPDVFQITANQGYRLLRMPQNGAVYLEPVQVQPVLTTYTRDETQQAEKDLMAGETPTGVRDNLITVLNSGRFNCLNHRVCDRFLYALGLAYELSGDLEKARDTYIQLWWENSSSPLTALGRLKLNFIAPTPTLTRTPTRTPTATAPTTPTPGATLTATP